jgi:nicotinamidase-related amidase
MKVLVCVDLQNDFCSPNGSLANPAAAALIPAIKERILDARKNNEMVIFTQDTHMEDYMSTLEGEKFPVEHCIYQTEGWEIVDELKDEAALCILKPTFMGFDLISRIETVAAAMNESVEIEVCGVCTDICIISNLLMLRGAFPNSIIKINQNLCAGTSKEKHEMALEIAKSCMIEVIDE